jgi:hypothetical protein
MFNDQELYIFFVLFVNVFCVTAGINGDSFPNRSDLWVSVIYTRYLDKI